MSEIFSRITVNSEQCGGRPCVRGMRIRVTDVLDLLANGLDTDQILQELPDLEAEDVSACLRFASQRLNHPVLAACF
ncbi:MAG: DUF433 domain-containing protein [Magnetococcales bacterium]|nr:DUF433 domain-containing protein [Magnetococcales bacterium]